VYGDAGSYGGLAGFSGPALGGVDAPVVRYQDLMRTSAPASAGVPEFGRIVQDGAQGFGAEPLPLPMLGGYGAFTLNPTYEDLKTYPVLSKGDSDKGAEGGNKKWSGEVRALQILLNKTFDATLVEDGWFGTATEKVVTGGDGEDGLAGAMADAADNRNAKAGKVGLNEWAYLYDKLPKTERQQAAEAEKKAAEAEKKGGKKKSAWEQALIGAGKRSGFITSGKEEEPKQEVSKDGDQTGTDWGKIALIGGGVLVGITSIVLITRALSDKE
jgi:hypothetical protein